MGLDCSCQENRVLLFRTSLVIRSPGQVGRGGAALQISTMTVMLMSLLAMVLRVAIPFGIMSRNTGCMMPLSPILSRTPLPIFISKRSFSEHGGGGIRTVAMNMIVSI